MTDRPLKEDTRPVPPEKPLPADCCETGCDVCVFEAYADSMENYRKALADWQRRNPSE